MEKLAKETEAELWNGRLERQPQNSLCGRAGKKVLEAAEWTGSGFP